MHAVADGCLICTEIASSRKVYKTQTDFRYKLVSDTAVLQLAAIATCGQSKKSETINRVLKLALQNGQAP